MDLFTISYLVLWVLVAVEAIILLAVLHTFGSFYLSTARGVSRDGLPIGMRAPDFESPALDGAIFRLSAARGQWVALVFAEPGCVTCYQLLPELGRLDAQLAGSAQIGFIFRGTVEDARAFPDLDAAPIPVIAVGRNGTFDRFRVRVSPFAQIVDPDGVVRAKGLANTRNAIEHLLAQAGFDHSAIEPHRLELTVSHEGGATNGR